MMLFSQKHLPPIHWISILAILTLFWNGMVFTINFAIDPFGNRNWIVDKKYKPIVHERSEKYNTIFNQNNIDKYDCVILGSSRVMSIKPSLNIATKECYNFGVHVANNPEKLFILQEWLKRSSLKKVYLGNELYNVHEHTRPLYLDPHSFISGSEGNYLSISTLMISFKTLQNSLKHQPQSFFEEDGTLNYFLDEQFIKEKTFNHSYNHFQKISQEAIEGIYIQNAFAYETKALEPLKRIKALCDQHHIKLYAFITPTFYETQLEMKSHPSLNTASERFRNDLISIFGEVYDFDTNTSENREPTNFYDPFHYRPQIGNQIINRMENKNLYGTYYTAQKRENSFYAQ